MHVQGTCYRKGGNALLTYLSRTHGHGSTETVKLSLQKYKNPIQFLETATLPSRRNTRDNRIPEDKLKKQSIKPYTFSRMGIGESNGILRQRILNDDLVGTEEENIH
jgi:hypothetical protein